MEPQRHARAALIAVVAMLGSSPAAAQAWLAGFERDLAAVGDS